MTPGQNRKNPFLHWIILAVCALNVIFLGGKRRAFGGFVASLRTIYPDVTLSELNWIGDSYSAVGYLMTTLVTWLVIYKNRKYHLSQFVGALFILASCVTSGTVPSPHWLFLTHTLLHGLGSGCVLATVGLAVSEHFPVGHPRRVMATTLVSGGSVASIIFVEAYAGLINQWGWRISFFILGGIYFFVTCLAAVVLWHSHIQKTRSIMTESCDSFEQYRANAIKNEAIHFRQITNLQIAIAIFWFIDRILTSVVTYGMLMNLTDYLYHRDNSSSITNITNTGNETQSNLVQSSLLTTLFAGGEALTYLAGTIISGMTRNFLQGKLKYILLVSSIGLGGCLATLGLSIDYVVAGSYFQSIIVFLAGLCLGPSVTFLFPGGEEITQLPGEVAYPLSLAGMGIGMLLSPILTARIAELFSYKHFFLVQAGLVLLKCIALGAATILNRMSRVPESPALQGYEEII